MRYPLIIDDYTWREFKIACAKDGRSMAAVLRSLIRKWLHEAPKDE